jgi:hypothetical protein
VKRIRKDRFSYSAKCPYVEAPAEQAAIVGSRSAHHHALEQITAGDTETITQLVVKRAKAGTLAFVKIYFEHIAPKGARPLKLHDLGITRETSFEDAAGILYAYFVAGEGVI